MTPRYLRHLPIAAAVVLPLLLTGCTQDEPVPKMPASSAPSPTADESEASPVEPTLPPEAQRPGKAGAEAFVGFYFAQVDHARRTGDTAELRKMALRSCTSCIGVTDLIERVERRGGSIVGGDQTVANLRLGQLTGVKGVATFRGTANVASTEQVIEGSGDNSLDGIYPAGSLKMSILVIRGGQGWRFAEWSVVS